MKQGHFTDLSASENRASSRFSSTRCRHRMDKCARKFKEMAFILPWKSLPTESEKLPEMGYPLEGGTIWDHPLVAWWSQKWPMQLAGTWSYWGHTLWKESNDPWYKNQLILPFFLRNKQNGVGGYLGLSTTFCSSKQRTFVVSHKGYSNTSYFRCW